jgi:hypothetical protein
LSDVAACHRMAVAIGQQGSIYGQCWIVPQPSPDLLNRGRYGILLSRSATRLSRRDVVERERIVMVEPRRTGMSMSSSVSHATPRWSKGDSNSWSHPHALGSKNACPLRRSSDARFAEMKNALAQRFVPDSPLEGDGFELSVPRSDALEPAAPTHPPTSVISAGPLDRLRRGRQRATGVMLLTVSGGQER